MNIPTYVTAILVGASFAIGQHTASLPQSRPDTLPLGKAVCWGLEGTWAAAERRQHLADKFVPKKGVEKDTLFCVWYHPSGKMTEFNAAEVWMKR